MTTASRISPADVRERVESNDAILVCAYQDEEKCRENRLSGALTFQEFQQRLPTLSKDESIVFY